MKLTQGVGVGVAVLIEDSEGRILLGQRKGSHGAGSWSVPGGHIDFGETPEHSCIRETFEETGLVIDNVQKHEVSYTNVIFEEGKHYITLFFTADVVDGTLALKEPDKCNGWKWFDLDSLPEPLFGGLSELLP